MAKTRIEFIDLAKGICILLVMFNHITDFLEIHPPLNDMMKSFRMPLYFFLSGLFFKRYENFPLFILRKVNKLLIPFVFFFLLFSVLTPNLLFYLGYHVRNTDNIGFWNSISVIFNPSIRSFSNGAIWFLLCLFWVNALFYLVVLLSEKMPKNKVLFIIVTCLFFGILGLYMSRQKIYLPLYIDSAVVALPFFCCGFLAHRYTHILLPNKFDKYIPLAIIVLGLYTFIFAVKVVFMSFEFGNGFFLYTCGISGTLMIILITKKLQKIPFISYIGRYSIIVLCTHMMVMHAVSIPIKKFFENVYGQAASVFLVVVACNIIIIPLCLRFLPYVTAQKDIIKIPQTTSNDNQNPRRDTQKV